jgi:hypothetical protein
LNTASYCCENELQALVAPPSRTRLAGWTGLTLLQIKRKALVPNEKKLSAEGRRGTFSPWPLSLVDKADSLLLNVGK